MDLNYIINTLGKNVFDFDYDFPEIVIGDKTYNKTLFEQEFIDYWLYYNIGYSTLNEFMWRLRRRVKSTISIFTQKLKLYPQELNLNERTLTKEFTNQSDNKYSDTPNEPMLDVDSDGKNLTDRTRINIDGNSVENETRNSLAKYAEVQKTISDTMFDYIKSFKVLFITDVIVETGIIKGGLYE